MKFTKMQGVGNDYVYINCFQEQVINPSELSKRVSSRHFGIGSDGLILITSSDCADFGMDMYNADGSRGEMCGNAIRCVGKYVYEYGMTEKRSVSVETLAGIKYLDLAVEAGKVTSVRVDMGSPQLHAAQIPIISDEDTVLQEPIEVDRVTYYMTGVSMGNPHAVIYMDEISEMEIEKLGPLFEFHKRFPRRINTEFAKVEDRRHVSMRVWERGSGETLACGTGACAVAVASILNGYTENTVTVKLLGGELQIEWDREKNRVFMTGPAEIVFDGELYL